jgi:uncharacterized protein YodC (DUF2158 family)
MSEEKKIKIGDVVRLKSGGPDLVVEQLLDDGKNNAVSARVSWWQAGTESFEDSTFDTRCLVIVDGAVTS